MAKTIFKALFYGKASPWERCVPHSKERMDIEKRIEAEKRYFIQKMSVDDCQRFQALESLYNLASEDEDIGYFTHGFIMGAALMLEIMAGKEGIINE